MLRYHILATDYDGTIAHNSLVDDETLASLEKLLASGRRLVMVTGRHLSDLQQTFPRLDLFELAVVENGGLLYWPATKEERALAPPPPKKFVDALISKGVGPIAVGQTIVATWEPHERTVLETIREQGLDLQVIFNKGAVMVLPAGVNKASGLRAALKEMGLSAHNVVGVGDAENDHAFLKLSEFSVAVANALAAVKETADLVTAADHGAGVAQLIDRMVEDDLAGFEQVPQRHRLTFGVSEGEEVRLPPWGRGILICGPSASGKSTVATRIVESLIEQKYQFCLIDPEGDYEEFAGAVVHGGPKSPPSKDEVLKLLADPRQNGIVCLTGMPIADRPPFFLELLSSLTEMRTRLGRPHWLVLDEAHHLMPAEWQPPADLLPEEIVNFLLITVHPELLAASLLERISTVIAVGPTAAEILKTFAETVGEPAPASSDELQTGEVLLWNRGTGQPPRRVKPHPSQTERRRHRRKYAEGQLPPDRSFYFKGAQGKLNLRAQNLILFLQLADGVDDETWEHHLRAGDYSAWFRESIKDDDLAAAARQVEQQKGLSPADSRELIRAAVEREYTVPAGGALPVPGAG